MWLSAALGLWLVLRADSIGERVSIAIYAVCITAMFGVSAAYHRMSWDERRGALMNRADNSTIFLAIAGSYTPLATHYLSGWQRVVVLGTVWTGAVLGIALQFAPKRMPRWFETLLYAVVGWSAMIALPQFLDRTPVGDLWLIGLGGLAYTLGALVYAFKWPDPWPATFGFHEVFHALTVMGAGFHMAAIWRIA